jgi:3-oxoacyl-[acyl-carrier protein] reductase
MEETVGARTILITGGMSDIGRTTALAFAQAGYRVAVNYRHRTEEAAAFAETLMREGGAPRAIAIAADVRHRSEVRALFDQACQALGGIDVLVNNAGINRDRAFLDMTDEEWDTVIGTILNGTFYCSQEYARRYAGDGGNIIILGAITALKGRRNGANYCSARAAALTLTKCLALELAPRIRVNAVTPGRIDTEELRARYALDNPQTRKLFEQEVPLHQLGRPIDIAAAMLYLVTNGTTITGQNLIIDGGLHLA